MIRFKGIWQYNFYFGLSTRTFEVIIIPVVKFLLPCSVSEILEDIKG